MQKITRFFLITPFLSIIHGWDGWSGGKAPCLWGLNLLPINPHQLWTFSQTQPLLTCISCCLLIGGRGLLRDLAAYSEGSGAMCPGASRDTRVGCQLQRRSCRLLRDWVFLKRRSNSDALKHIFQHKPFSGRAWFSLLALGGTWLFHTGPNSGIQFKTTNLSDHIYRSKGQLEPSSAAHT